MTITRRNLLFGMGAAAAATTVSLPFPAAALPKTFPAWAAAFAPRMAAATGGGPVLLNSNENPYGPFPSVLAMGEPFEGVNRYPDHRFVAITEKLAALNKVSADRVVTGCGSTEILRITACAFSGPSKKVVIASPTFEALGAYADAAKAQVAKVPLTANYAHDMGAMLKAAGSDAGLIYICNPNNPTASVTPRADIEDCLRKLPRHTYVLIDEAYHDFAVGTPGYSSFIEQPMDDSRVIVARTFSKIYGLAGMRLGYAVAAKETAQQMREYRLEDSLNAFVIRCGLASLDDAAGHKQAQERNARDRDEFVRQAGARKLKVIPSATNFVMVESGRPIRSVIGHFRQNHVEIGRPFPPLEMWARISLGTPEQMTRFWSVWDQMAMAELPAEPRHFAGAEALAWKGGVC